MKRTIIIFCIGLIMAGGQTIRMGATVFYNETFSYSDGVLTSASGGLWAAHSGTNSYPVTVSSGTISLVQGSGTREDVHRSTGTAMGLGDTWYAGFDVTVSGGNTTVYFAHFLLGTSYFGSRVFVTTPPGGSGDFTFGIGGATSPHAVWPVALSYNTTYRLVVSYDYDTGAGYLWVNPAQQSDPSIYTTNYIANAFTAFAFRQASGNSTQVIDNLVVGTSFIEVVPEPATAALAALCGLGVVLFRRRK